MPDYYDQAGRPMTMEEWGRAMQADPDGRRVGRTEVGEHLVSTVWLGLDHSYDLDGPPLIFETMIFHQDRPARDLYCRRYGGRTEALEGHEATVEALRSGALQLDEE